MLELNLTNKSIKDAWTSLSKIESYMIRDILQLEVPHPDILLCFAPLTKDWDNLIEMLEDDIKTKLVQMKPPLKLPKGY